MPSARAGSAQAGREHRNLLRPASSRPVDRELSQAESFLRPKGPERKAPAVVSERKAPAVESERRKKKGPVPAVLVQEHSATSELSLRQWARWLDHQSAAEP